MGFLNPRRAASVPTPSTVPFSGIAAPFTYTWGESTGQGLFSNVALTQQWSIPGGYCAVGGTRPLDGGLDLSVDFASFVPIFAQTVAGYSPDGAIGNVGETMDNGALRAYGQALLQLSGIDIATTGQRYIQVNGAIGGRNQGQLNTGLDWTQTQNILAAYASRASTDGFTTQLVAIQEAIGQNDMTDGTSASTFIANMVTGRQQVISYWNSQSGRSDNPKLLFMTVGSFNDTGNDLSIPMAMSQLPFDNTDFINAGPTYIIPYADGVGVHYANTGEIVYGNNIGWARYLLTRNQRWSVPTIDTLVRSGSSVKLGFKGVFAAPLTFNTSWVSDPGNYGFILMQGDQAKATSCSITAGVLTVGGTVTGTFAVGQTIWACKYTGLGNVSAGCTIVSSGGANIWNLSDAAVTVNAGATITGQTVAPINTPTITGSTEVTLTTQDGSSIPAGYVVSYASRGTRAAGPTTGSRGCLCDSTAFAVANPDVAFTVRGYGQVFERTLT